VRPRPNRLYELRFSFSLLIEVGAGPRLPILCLCSKGNIAFHTEVALIIDSGESSGVNDHANDTSADGLENDGYPVDGESKPLFEAAFREHHDSLIRFLRRRVHNDADARDIAQEAYLRLFRYRENQDFGSLKALVFRIAKNLLGMRARTERAHHWRDHESLSEGHELPADDPSLERRLDAEQQLNRLMEIIKRLPTKCQQAFVLSRFHDMSYSEIAARCGISVKTVEKHVAHALAVCRRGVGDNLP
jgi:RNA polymerase sigma factor (sigma-70 family)